MRNFLHDSEFPNTEIVVNQSDIFRNNGFTRSANFCNVMRVLVFVRGNYNLSKSRSFKELLLKSRKFKELLQIQGDSPGSLIE